MAEERRLEDSLGTIQAKALNKIFEATTRACRSARLHQETGSSIIATVDRNYIIAALNEATVAAHQLGVEDVNRGRILL